MNDRETGTATPEHDVAIFRDYRAPRNHGEAFVEPHLSRAPDLLQSNQLVLSEHMEPLQSLRRRARPRLIEDAIRYTSTYRNVDWLKDVEWLKDVDWRDGGVATGVPIIMAGHQPAIFHPGVWFKNFALSHLATQTGAVAVNLVIDNDVASGCSVRVPTIDSDSGQAMYRMVPYDDAGGGVPYEQTTITSRATFDRFDAAVAEAAAPLVKDPCVGQLWAHARTAVERCGIAGCALAQARHGLEGELGLQTLEIPLGVACRGREFAEFVLLILGELPRFCRCYNEAADQFRAAHGIRSSAHPVPNLAEDGKWFEAPLWIYGDDAPQRRPAWAQLSDDHLILSDRAGREASIDLRFPKLAAEQLAGIASPNFKLRPRALLTTMYARLVLSDLFLHGIGGGKYDQLSDQIIQSFFMLTPPEFMVTSATVQLPSVGVSDDENRIRFLKRAIRDTRFQPERFACDVELDSDLLQKKRMMLNRIPPLGQRKPWQEQMRRINESLSASLGGKRESLLMELAEAERHAVSQDLLSSREHPFCVFPLDYLTDTYRSLLR